MRKLITLPGIGGSDDSHWQTLWEHADTRFRRFRPQSWDQPELANWGRSLELEVGRCSDPPVLVAHSLGCLLVADWAARSQSLIAGAFLVCVPDPEGSLFPKEASTFCTVPAAPLRFPSLIVASVDDPYATLDYTQRRCRDWGSGLVIAGALGHINSASGLSDWPQGRALLEAFCAGMPRPNPTL